MAAESTAAETATRSSLQAVLPEYELLGELGRGSMGVVLAGRHRTLDRHVAVKELPAGFAADQSVRQRFLHEAQTLASLNHPHVVQVYDFLDRDGHLALVMERLPGGTVWDRFTSRGVTAAEACGLILSAAAGLDHAHRHGVLHRDVKPENLLFTDQGWLKVTDFGIAKVMGGERTLATADGAILGTPAYMAPEQAEGLAVGPPADVYACGTILYEMLTGRLPFAQATTPLATLIKRVRDDAPPVATWAPQVPAAIAEVVDTSLARAAGRRFGTVEDFAVALGQAAAGTWGSNWLAATGLMVTGSDAIEWAARTARPGGGGTLTGAPVPADVTRPRSAPATMLDDFSRISPSELVSVAEVAPRPRRRPILAWLAALVLAAVTSTAAWTGGGAPPDGAVPRDFSRPLVFSDLGPGSEATLRFSALGLPLGVIRAPLDASGRAQADPGYLRWTAVGVLDVAVEVDGAPRPGLVAVATQPWLTTGPVAALTLAALFGLASVASHRRGLRRPRAGLGSYVGLAGAGAVLGATAAGYAWAGTDVVLSVAGVVGPAALGALSGVMVALATRRSWSRMAVASRAAEPRVRVQPGSSTTGARSLTPSMNVPLLEPRSATTRRPSASSNRRWRRDTR